MNTSAFNNNMPVLAQELLEWPNSKLRFSNKCVNIKRLSIATLLILKQTMAGNAHLSINKMEFNLRVPGIKES